MLCLSPRRPVHAERLEGHRQESARLGVKQARTVKAEPGLKIFKIREEELLPDLHGSL